MDVRSTIKACSKSETGGTGAGADWGGTEVDEGGSDDACSIVIA
jgi:hypothetical protein